VESFALVPAQETLFDAAQCERRLGEWRAAEQHYQMYLDGPADDPGRALAQHYLAELQAKIGVPLTALSPMRQRLRRVPLSARVLFGIGVSSLVVGGFAIGGGGIILAGDQTTPGTGDHSLYGAQVASANDLGYAGEALLGVGVVALVGSVIWGALATSGAP
jgi:hypothetical protein